MKHIIAICFFFHLYLCSFTLSHRMAHGSEQDTFNLNLDDGIAQKMNSLSGNEQRKKSNPISQELKKNKDQPKKEKKTAEIGVTKKDIKTPVPEAQRVSVTSDFVKIKNHILNDSLLSHVQHQQHLEDSDDIDRAEDSHRKGDEHESNRIIRKTRVRITNSGTFISLSKVLFLVLWAILI